MLVVVLGNTSYQKDSHCKKKPAFVNHILGIEINQGLRGALNCLLCLLRLHGTTILICDVLKNVGFGCAAVLAYSFKGPDVSWVGIKDANPKYQLKKDHRSSV